ncbi:SDR family oxidoreductase [Mycolicibacterium sediminis]|uniref:Nucleoside-diphosphate sugar epimerase n=1 Tax=Mycolicibacterium sediminis TaxID=1286180 RepID=A0A7I7QSJ3_9MYCO|nr:SDR family oxidoreductase [Mycolicibacterium sediminis]BBY28937.1 nucleoside-diphosphate sugar epimerase [Mycolicibacterium sediminis]
MRLVIAGATGTVGRHVVSAARYRGHEVVALSRSSGQDIVNGAGLVHAMAGADAVVDVTSTETTSAATSTTFFTAVTANLSHAEREAGVTHHVALSIVGIDTLNVGYYAGKLAQERAVGAGLVPWSLLRATQFHEFAEQVIRRGSLGPLVAVPKILVRPVAAREVGRRLVEIAEGAPLGRTTDLAGPDDESLAQLVRRMLAFDGSRRRVVELSLPGKYWRGSASGILRGDEGALRGRIGFDEWLVSDDHDRL